MRKLRQQSDSHEANHIMLFSETLTRQLHLLLRRAEEEFVYMSITKMW